MVVTKVYWLSHTTDYMHAVFAVLNLNPGSLHTLYELPLIIFPLLYNCPTDGQFSRIYSDLFIKQ